MKIVAVTILILIILSLIGAKVFFGNSNQNKTSQLPITSSSPISNENNSQDSLISEIASGLEVPWAIAFLPNKDFLVTERKGTVKLVKDNNVSDVTLDIKVNQTGESGLHGIAVDPKYPEQPYVYLYYTYSADGDNSLNKVSRFNFNGQLLKNEQVLVDKIPGATIHDGGRIKFGPDGYLYITTGDAANPSLSQDKNSLAGKILRVVNGKVEMYSYGHRNPQGIAWDNQGNLFETEHGQSSTDEFNQIQQGANYGWPDVRGEQSKPGINSPILQSGSDTWAPGGLAFYNGSFIFAGLRGQALYEYSIDTKQLTEHFKNQLGRIREVVLGPDNYLYITTSNKDGRGNPKSGDDKILKINPSKL